MYDMYFNENEFSQHLTNLFIVEIKCNTNNDEHASSDNQYDDLHVTEYELIKTIWSLEWNKSSGCDNIPSYLNTKTS